MLILLQDSRDYHLESILHNFVPADPRLDPLQAAYYTNVTGFSRGDSKFHNITLASLVNETQPWTEAAMQYMADANTTTMPGKLGTWNWTDNRIAFSASEKREAKPVSEDMVHINVPSQSYPIYHSLHSHRADWNSQMRRLQLNSNLTSKAYISCQMALSTALQSLTGIRSSSFCEC